jgi:hypothetical protein
MLKPYSTVEETPSEITYEFKTIYLWILYGILAVAGIGLLLKQPILGYVAGGCMLFYFLTVSLQYRKLGAMTKNAALRGSVTYSGSKWSFSNPLRVTIPNKTAEQGVADEPAAALKTKAK